MNPSIKQFTDYVINQNSHNKEELIKAVQQEFRLKQIKENIFQCNNFTVRFCFSKNKSFPGTVLGISVLSKFDDKPFLVVLCSLIDVTKIYLVNSTLIDKVSQSSQKLSENNYRGSFNGSDIIKTHDGIDNNADNIEKLFNIHKQKTWEENFKRILKNTQSIKPKGKFFNVDEEIRQRIHASIKRAKIFIESTDFDRLKQELDKRVNLSQDAILLTSRIDNKNIRGRLIEVLITSNDKEREIIYEYLNNYNIPEYKSRNKLGDYVCVINSTKTLTDIKTSIISKSKGSNPKAYNVDKFLEEMSHNDSVFFFYFIKIDENSSIKTALCSVYHNTLIENTVVQFHWAGRNSRGVTQFIGKAIDKMIDDPDFSNQIEYKQATEFIDRLIDYHGN